MDFEFKVPSTVPQDLLLIQDLIGTNPPLTVTVKHTLYSSDDSIASTDSEIESEDEVEADLAPRDEDSGVSANTSDSESNPGSELDTDSSDSEEGRAYDVPQQRRPADGMEDEESGVVAAATYLQTKNEIVNADILVPTISEVEPCDRLEKVGEIMSIIGNIVIVRGLPVNHPDSLPMRALDAESLLVFEDRKILGYVYETFGPTSQPLYQVKFAEHSPLDTSKVWLSREVFHVPQRSYFVFVDRLKRLRGSDASNIHDEEPAEDEIDFSDDEKEAAFRAQRKKRRGGSVSSSRQSTPASTRIHIDDMAQDTYRGSNPYDAHGPYDDDYHVAGPSRPPPAPYDDPYTDVPTSDVCAYPMETNERFGESQCEGRRNGPATSRGRISRQGAQRRGDRKRPLWDTPGRGYRQNRVASQRRLGPGSDQPFPAADECATGYHDGRVGDVTTHDPCVQPASNARFFPETDNVQTYQFIQPHINPRFASLLGLNMPPGPMSPWTQHAHDRVSPSQNWVDTWTMQLGGAGSESEGDTYRPM